MFILYVKTAVSITLSLFLIGLLWQRTRVTDLLHQTGTWVLTGCWVLFRLAPFLLTYVWLGYEPQSDVAKFYYPIGVSALEGGIPYRDVYNCYSPLFGYWLAPFLFLWKDPRMVVLAMIIVEGVAVRLTYHYYQTSESPGERLFRGLFYYLLPLPFVMTVFSGQEDVLLWLFMLLAIPFLQTRPYAAGLVLGLGMLATKAVFVLMLIPVWLLSLRNIRFTAWFTAGLITVGLPVVVFMYWKTGLLFLEQQAHEGDYLKAPNWRSVLNPFLTDGLRSAVLLWKWGGLVVTMAVMLRGVWLVQSRQTSWRYEEYIPFIYILTYSAMTVVQQNAISNYAYLFMLPLIFTMVNFRRTGWCVALIGFNALAAIHPTLWWRLGQLYYNRFSAFRKPSSLLEYSIEVLLVIGFIYYAIQAMNALRRPTSVTKAEPYAV